MSRPRIAPLARDDSPAAAMYAGVQDEKRPERRVRRTARRPDEAQSEPADPPAAASTPRRTRRDA